MLALRAAVRAAAAAPGGAAAAAAAVRPAGLAASRAAFSPSAVRWQSVEAAPAAGGGADVSPKVGQLVKEIVDLNMLEVKQLTDALKVRPVERAAGWGRGRWRAWLCDGAWGGGGRVGGVAVRASVGVGGRGGSGGGVCLVLAGLPPALALDADVLHCTS